MDDDERYNRKLEAGLYTLQVLHNGMVVLYLICVLASVGSVLCLPYNAS